MRHRAVTRFGVAPWVALWMVLVLVVSWGLTACSGQPESKTAAGAAPTLPAATPAATPAQSAAGSPSKRSEEAGETTAVTPTPTPYPSRSSVRSKGGTETEEPAKPESLSARAERDHKLIVIDEPRPPQPESLADAARRAREERGDAPQRRIVITDDNLAEYATGQLTVAAPARAAEEDGSAGASADDPGRDEDHWRQGARELRLKLRRAWDDAHALAEQAAGLRTRFYAEDDPYVRDAQIKPAWDRALDGQRQAELEVKATRRELDEFLEAGRRAGALPGWLREGIEHEPDFEDDAEGEDTEAVDGFDRHRPVEPERMENPSRPPGR